MSLALRCESCGMPMETREEHGAQKPSNPYCIHCTDMNGKLVPFGQKFGELVEVAMKTRWMKREEAEETVRIEMGQMPAWKNRISAVPK